MTRGRRSVGAWASAALETVLGEGRTPRLPRDEDAAPALDPPGSLCRYALPGHGAHPVSAERARSLRAGGHGDRMSLVGHRVLDAGTLAWSDRSVAGADPTRPVLRMELARQDGSTAGLLTHRTHAAAALDACGGVGLWWVPQYSLLLVPSWDLDLHDGPHHVGEPTSWTSISVASCDEPWIPCPIAAA
ncbi:MAG: hypothetical protein GC157_10150 [Frankiales bacterium]|nr:hypothetical protein [Frankiales bacterium]